MFVSETYSIQDCIKYIASGSETYSSSTLTFTKLAELPTADINCEASCYITPSVNKGVNLLFKKVNDASNTYFVRCGGESSVGRCAYAVYTSSPIELNDFSPHTILSTSSPTLFKINIQNGSVTFTIGDLTYTTTNPVTGLKYVGFFSWSTSKTVSYTDLKVKPL